MTQTVLRRYADHANPPAQCLTGTFLGTETTKSCEAPAIVITEDYGKQVGQWQSGSMDATLLPAVLQPKLRDANIIGHSTDGWISSGSVNDEPYAWNKESPDLYGGFFGAGMGGEVSDVNIFGIPGTAMRIYRHGSLLKVATQPFDRIRWNVQRVNIARVFRGFDYATTDGACTDIEVWRFRNWGVKLSGNAIQFARIHSYGGGYVGDKDAPDGVNGVALWISGTSNHGVDCYAESAPLGLYFGGNHNKLAGLRSHTNSVSNVVFAGGHNRLTSGYLGVSSVGANFGGQYNLLADTSMELAGAATGIVLNSGAFQTVRDVKLMAWGNKQATGIRVKGLLTACKIEAHLTGGDRAIVFEGAGAIGVNNFIRLTTSNGTVSPSVLPVGWTTTPKRTSNFIQINGIQYFPAKDEF